MKSFAHRVATPLTTGLFAVAGISGVALFFHAAPGVFHEMHEWLSMVLLVPFALHVWKNWPALLGYARRGALWLPMGAGLALAVPFAAPALLGAEPAEGGPGGKTTRLMTQAPLFALAPVLKTTPDELAARLRQQGYAVKSLNVTLDMVATQAGTTAGRLLFDLEPRP